jgi:nitroreductase
MPTPCPEALDFLLTRRSCPAKTLGLPVPDRADLVPLLTAAARTPDHGKLVPWRFIVLGRAALARLSAAVATCDAAADMDAAAITKAQRQFDESHLAVR